MGREDPGPGCEVNDCTLQVLQEYYLLAASRAGVAGLEGPRAAGDREV